MLHKPQREWTMSDWALSDWQQFGDRLISVKTEGRAFKIIYLQHHVWVRPDGQSADFTGVVMDGRYGGDTQATPDERRVHFLENWRSSRVGRLLVLPDPLDARSQIFAAANQRNVWLLREDYEYDTWTTHSQPLPFDETQLWNVSQSDLRSWIEADWKCQAPSLMQALKWHRLSHTDRSWEQLAWTRGSRQELGNLTRWMAHSDASLWRERPLWGINYKFHPDGSANIESLRARTILRPPSERERRLGTLFLEWNQAKLQRPPQMPPLTPAHNFAPDHDAFIHIRFTEPSMHDIAEAYVGLSAWLKGKMPPEEIELLLKDK